MSKQIHDEADRRKQVKFRAPENLVEAYDDAVAGARSEALRQHMRQIVNDFGAPASDVQPFEAPDDSDLEAAYHALVETRNIDAIVPGKKARRVIAVQVAHADQKDAYAILKKLADRGYVSLSHSEPGKASRFHVGVRPWYGRDR